MKVFVVNPSLFSPFYDYHLCRALSGLGVKTTMVGRPLRKYERRESEPFDFAEIFYRGTSRNQSTWRTSRFGHWRKGLEHTAGLRALEKLVISEGIDIVHFQWLVVPFLDRMSLRRLRDHCGLVLTVHNSEISTHSTDAVLGGLGARLQSFGQKAAVLEFDRFVAHTAKTVERVLELGVDSSRLVRRSHPPLDLDVPSSVLQECDTYAANEQAAHNILFFGSIKPYKGVDLLVEAGIAMSELRRDFTITIAGRPFQSMEALQQRVRQAGVEDLFEFDLNYVSDEQLARYLAKATLVVFPYREIDGSGALSHAVKFDKPIVASKVGGFTEEPFKDYLEFVPPNDSSALGRSLDRLLSEPGRRAELGKKTLRLKELLPTWDDYARACIETYSAIAK